MVDPEEERRVARAIAATQPDLEGLLEAASQLGPTSLHIESDGTWWAAMTLPAGQDGLPTVIRTPAEQGAKWAMAEIIHRALREKGGDRG